MQDFSELTYQQSDTSIDEIRHTNIISKSGLSRNYLRALVVGMVLMVCGCIVGLRVSSSLRYSSLNSESDLDEIIGKSLQVVDDDYALPDPPTKAPAPWSPTLRPTPAPSSPTLIPTLAPSSPTSIPTIAPSSPTVIPSIIPSSPTVIPTRRPTKSPGKKKTFFDFSGFKLPECFAGSETVQLESGEIKMLANIQIGDRVLSYSSSENTFKYSDVVFIPHDTNQFTTTFVNIETNSGKSIKMTKNHLIPSGDCNNDSELFSLTSASKVKLSKCIMTVSGKEEVSSVTTSIAKGIYTIVLQEDYVVINGIIASPFATSHVIPHAYYNIHRLIYSYEPRALTSMSFKSIHNLISVLVDQSSF